MGYADELGNREYTVSNYTEIEWDVKKLGKYFKDCQQIYEDFLRMSDTLIRKFEAFQNDTEHTGTEAESSKAFIKECENPFIVGLTHNIQQLEDLQVNLMTAFLSVDKSDKAILKTTHLKQVIGDYMGYEASLKSVGDEIKELAKELNAECSAVGRYTVPEYKDSMDAMLEMTSENGEEKLVPELLKAFVKFDEAHKNDIKGSDFKVEFEILAGNIKKFMNGIGDGRYYDITTFDQTREKLDWKDPKDVLTGVALEDYETYAKSMEDYLKGMNKRCEVYKYDPVNMCNGNYINEYVDIKLGGKYPVEFKRFYNAIAEHVGTLGRGWSHTYEIKLTEEDGNIGIRYADGKKGIFEKVGDYYFEKHGEFGILEKLKDGYIIRHDQGNYQKFDKNGFLTVLGDNDGDNTFLTYEPLKKGKALLKKVETNSGNQLSFSYSSAFDNEIFLEKITDQTGRSVCFTYSDDKLVKIKETNGTIHRFTYSVDGRVKDVINGKGITTITNLYDAKGRAIKQSFPDGNFMTYEYDDNKKTTTAYEQNNNIVVYTHDDLGRHTKTTYYDGEERYTYNKKNQKISVTDKKGNTTRYSYDNKGHLTKVIDAAGNKVCYTYRADGKLLSMKGTLGEVSKYSYDTEGHLFEIKNPLGEVERFYYDGGNLVKAKNALGVSTIYEYDERGNVTSVTDPDGVVTLYKYDLLNRVIETVTGDGASTKYEYDAMDNVVSTTDALGGVRKYTYDEDGEVVSFVETDGTTKTYERDCQGRISKVVNEAGNVFNIFYNSMGKQEKIVLPNGGVVKYEYDPLMRLTRLIDPEGRSLGYEYDANGNKVAEYLGDIKTKAYEYDELNHVTKETDALGNETKYEYDSNGNVITITDAAGNVFSKKYDLLGRVITEEDSIGSKVCYTYTKLNYPESVTDSLGRVRKFEYTRGGKVSAIYFCGQKEQTFEYDKAGRMKKRILADGYTVEYTYDQLDRVSKVNGSDGREISYFYDAVGRVTKVIDGHYTTSYAYTPTGKISSVVDALGNETAYTYDVLDNLKSVQRAEGKLDENDKQFPIVGKDGHVTIYDYDLSGKLTAVTDALGQTEHYEYDEYGRLKSKVDRDDYLTEYSFNNAGNIANVCYADGRSVEFSYNALNQLNEIRDWLGKTSIENDIYGRPTKVTDYKNRTVAYEYDLLGQKTKLIYPDGRVAEYHYDEKSKLISIAGNGEEIKYSYDDYGRLSNKLMPNGVSTAYNYLPGGNLDSLTSYDVHGELDHYTYHYTNNGRVDYVDRTRRDLPAVSGKYDYKYDALGRLLETRQNGVVKSSYEYDAFGNRVSFTDTDVQHSYRYDALDRLIETNEISESKNKVFRAYEYDKRGNQTKEYVDGNLNKTFVFDATNMLVKAVDVAKGEATNEYNGLGYRVSATLPEERIEYLCDISKDCFNLLERTVNGETENFIYDDNVVSMSKTGKNYYYLQDELGSPMYMTGTDGCVVSSYAFDDFGRNLDPTTGKVRKHEYKKDGNIIQPFVFTGYQEDEITNLKFAQARFYSAENGRFVGEDQVKGIIERPDTLNPFHYCLNNPCQYVDSNGKWLKEKINSDDAVAIGVMTVLTVAAVVAIIVVATATAPLSVPVMIACGATIGAAVGFDASVIWDWFSGLHANLAKAFDWMMTGAAIGAAIFCGWAYSIAEGGLSFARLCELTFKNPLIKTVLSSTVAGFINLFKKYTLGDEKASFTVGFLSLLYSSLFTIVIPGPIGHFLSGFAYVYFSEYLSRAENGEAEPEGDELVCLNKKAITFAIIMAFLGPVAGVYDDIMYDGLSEPILYPFWFLLHEVHNMGLIGEVIDWILNYFFNPNCKGN